MHAYDMDIAAHTPPVDFLKNVFRKRAPGEKYASLEKFEVAGNKRCPKPLALFSMFFRNVKSNEARDAVFRRQFIRSIVLC